MLFHFTERDYQGSIGCKKKLSVWLEGLCEQLLITSDTNLLCNNIQWKWLFNIALTWEISLITQSGTAISTMTDGWITPSRHLIAFVTKRPYSGCCNHGDGKLLSFLTFPNAGYFKKEKQKCTRSKSRAWLIDSSADESCRQNKWRLARAPRAKR